MRIEKKLRKLQDNLRNSGWRIQWIPWQDSGKPEYVFNTRLTYFLIVLGLGMFFGGIFLIAKISSDSKFISIAAFNPVWIGVGVTIFGMTILIGSRVVAAYQKQKGWIKIEATCIDREVVAGKDYSGDNNGTVFWDYRLLCVFYFNGRQYKVTPESSEIVGFGTENSVNEYLDSRISSENKCFLYIDPRNPRHAIFDCKQIM